MSTAIRRGISSVGCHCSGSLASSPTHTGPHAGRSCRPMSSPLSRSGSSSMPTTVSPRRLAAMSPMMRATPSSNCCSCCCPRTPAAAAHAARSPLRSVRLVFYPTSARSGASASPRLPYICIPCAVWRRRALGKASMLVLCSHLRMFLGYLLRERLLIRDLRPAVEAPRTYRLAALPRSISWDEVRRLLEIVDRRTPLGKRDYAIMLLLVTYGLRAREVAALT